MGIYFPDGKGGKKIAVLSYEEATPTESGLMSANEKVKSDEISDTVSSGNIYIPAKTFDSIMANFTS